MNLKEIFSQPLLPAIKDLFKELHVPINYISDEPTSAKQILKDTYKDNHTFQLVNEVYFVGMVDDAAFEGNKSLEANKIKSDYDGILVFGVTLHTRENNLLPTRSQLAEISRAFNREYYYTPVVLIFKYTCQKSQHIAFANTERLPYKQAWREGEKVGKVTMLKDINIERPHAAHLRILQGLTINTDSVYSFAKLYRFWQVQFSLQALNDQFYKDLQDWFYFAIQNIKLPFRPDYLSEKENIKNFLVRLLARTLFCWFVKEKGLIKPELLELTNWEGNKYQLTNDIDNVEFLKGNSYYRGILQNMFYCALNQKDKKTLKDFKWTKYLNTGFKIEWFTEIPYLNGGIFDKLFEDNTKESIEDAVMSIPNFLFYGIETEDTVSKGKGAKAVNSIQKVEHKGLNGILKSYKFTLDENTPFEEDIALDPEMLGLVFENLLAELDPNLEESTIKSIRKLTGSYYTPRKVIFEMVNDSLFLYLSKFLKINYPQIEGSKDKVSELVYFNHIDASGKEFCSAVVHGLDKFKMLDPATGSGAFPMGMLHRMVDILKLVDKDNDLWITLKLKNVDVAQRGEFKKVLTSHLDDYSRKLGIIRDSIYGIDIQPLAVQITKLRFFISLLIDQRTDKGVTPMPNIETKIICADSLKSMKTDMFSNAAIAQLTLARTRYYQPDISHEEREAIADEIVAVLDTVFPTFAYQITGKRIAGQNKAMIKEWFKHSTIAAPFFNMDFFFPELNECNGFDCVIGNPPYGGTKISDDVRESLGIESKDPYGAFIARFLSSADKPTPLKNGGVLAYIASDTFMTIKSHLPLRRMLMQNYVHKMLRMHPDTFRATVNTVIIVAERNVYATGANGLVAETYNKAHTCLMADLTNISIHDNYDHFNEVLNQTKGAAFESNNTPPCISNGEYAIYYYPQVLIKTNSNLPFFVASPKLFALMNDGNPIAANEYGTRKKFINQINGSIIHLFFLGDEYSGSGKSKKWLKSGLLKIVSGIKTGSNDKYVYKSHNGRGEYKIVDEKQLLSEDEIKQLSDYDILNGISDEKFQGRCIVPLDKGGESDSDDGWMPNYFVPTSYFVDWSHKAFVGMTSETSSDLANSEFRFKKGLTYSRTGIYAPTFRISSGGILESKGCGLFSDFFEPQILLGILNSKIVKYLIKNCVMHSVESSVGTLPGTMIALPGERNIEKINLLVNNILTQQKSNPRYDYASHEQIEIDKLVYEAYGLNADDVQEVEDWYARRYPKLSAAQKQNLRNLGKSDDYLELYGMKKV